MPKSSTAVQLGGDLVVIRCDSHHVHAPRMRTLSSQKTSHSHQDRPSLGNKSTQATPRQWPQRHKRATDPPHCRAQAFRPVPFSRPLIENMMNDLTLFFVSEAPATCAQILRLLLS